MNNGDRAWFVDRGIDEVLHGTVVASGPDMLVIDVDGPWSNVVCGMRMAPRSDARPGMAPPMGGESFAAYFYRCLAIVDRDRKVAALKRDAERLGLKVTEGEP